MTSALIYPKVIFHTLVCICCFFDIVSSAGIVTYSEVTSFLKKQPNIMTEYKSITTLNGTITLTGNHLVYARKVFADQFNPM